MDKILALLGEIKGFITGSSAKLDKITAAEDRVKALESDLVKANQALESEKSEHSKTKESLQKAQDEVNAKGTEVKDLQAAVETEKNRANAVIASQGLSGDLVPGNTPGASEGSTVEVQVASLRKKITASNDPAEKYTLSAQIKELLKKKN